MNARQIANLAYMLLTEGADVETVAQIDASLFDGALEDWEG